MAKMTASERCGKGEGHGFAVVRMACTMSLSSRTKLSSIWRHYFGARGLLSSGDFIFDVDCRRERLWRDFSVNRIEGIAKVAGDGHSVESARPVASAPLDFPLVVILESKMREQYPDAPSLEYFASLPFSKQLSLFFHAWSEFEKHTAQKTAVKVTFEQREQLLRMLHVNSAHLDRIFRRVTNMRRSTISKDSFPEISAEQIEHIDHAVAKHHAESGVRNRRALYTQLMKSTGLPRVVVRQLAQKAHQKISRQNLDLIAQSKDIILEKIHGWKRMQKEHPEQKLSKRELYSMVEQSVDLSRVQIREVVRNLLLKLREEEVGPSGETHRAVIERIMEVNAGCNLSSIANLYPEMEAHTGLTRRKIYRIVMSIYSLQRSPSDEDRSIITEEMARLDQEEHSHPDASVLYDRIQERTTLSRLQIRRLVTNARLKQNRSLSKEERQFIAEYIEQHHVSDSSEVYSFVQERFGLSRDRAREVVHQERVKLKQKPLSNELRAQVAEIVNTHRDLPSSQLYTLIQERTGIPRTQIRHLVRSARDKMSKQ